MARIVLKVQADLISMLVSVGVSQLLTIDHEYRQSQQKSYVQVLITLWKHEVENKRVDFRDGGSSTQYRQSSANLPLAIAPLRINN